ncbi:MAG: hypothetical protein HY717_24170 [Planctomycetes bacterium]|nr:hypothetical protein [Planctomycetota bacterium]
MKTYAAIFTFVPDIMERRLPYREAHLKHFYELRDAGKILLAGPWADPYDGALVVFRAESPDEVERLIQEDAYYQARLWTNILIREWDMVIVTDVSAVITPKVP